MEAKQLDLTILIMVLGIVFIILSFLIKDRSKRVEQDLEDLSINIYQETNSIKRRLKVVEEELLLDGPLKVTPKPMKQQPFAQATQEYATPAVKQAAKSAANKPVHSILVSQVLELGKKGMSVDEIQKRSALTADQILHILQTGGN